MNTENSRIPIPGNNPDLVTDTTKAPFFTVGLLKMTFPNGQLYIGTATLIAKEGESESKYLLTCAHNLYDDGDGGEVTKVSFKRAFSSPDEPFAEIEADDWFYPEGFEDVAISKHTLLAGIGRDLLRVSDELDYAVVKLKQAVQLNSFPYIKVEKDSDLSNLEVQLNGYGFFGDKMSSAEGEISSVENQLIQYPISTDGGASGTVVLDKNDETSIVGIHVRGIPSETINEAVRITKKVKDEIEDWMS